MAGVDGTTGNASAKITLNWNLFNGGSDSARSAQYGKKLDAARDMRDKACRDIRMTLAIAYNDISKLKEQLNFMDQHQLAIEKARVAYQQQFDIGQRSLLDLLDTENELYQARRSYTNAEYDLATAYARTLAGMGQLVSSLEVSRLETANLPELLGTSSDAAENCPVETPVANNLRLEELDAHAIEEAKATIDASRAKEAAEKEKRAKEDEEFLMTLEEAKKAAKLKKEQGAKASETEPAGMKAGQGAQATAEEKARQATEARKAKKKAKEEAKAEEERQKAEQKAKAKAEKQSAAEAIKAAQAEDARLKAEKGIQAASEAEAARLKAEQEAEEKARQVAEAKAAKIKAREEAKAEAARLKAEQKAKAEADAQAKREAKAEAARLRAAQKAKTQAEEQAAAKAEQAAETEAVNSLLSRIQPISPVILRSDTTYVSNINR